MQKSFLVINKTTQMAEYLSHRSIIEVTEEHRSLTELDITKLGIIDVDRFIYVYYATDDGDLSFRSDMNMLRQLLASAFFHTTEITFILVECKNPLLEDLIHSAIKGSGMAKDKVEIIHHEGSLMFNDVSKYLLGSSSGQDTTSSYKSVYIREADTEEKERYSNEASNGLDAVLPVLTDTAAMYGQRSSVEAVSAGRMVSDILKRPLLTTEFSRVKTVKQSTTRTFILSGAPYTNYWKGAGYLARYAQSIGQRTLIISIDSEALLDSVLTDATQLNLASFKSAMTPERPLAVVNARFGQLAYIIELLGNIRGVETYIFVAPSDSFVALDRLLRQLHDTVYSSYVSHYTESGVKSYLAMGITATSMFLTPEVMFQDFDVKAFKEELAGTLVAEFPLDDVDSAEFYDYSAGGGLLEQ